MKISSNSLIDTLKQLGYTAKLHEQSQQVYTSYTHEDNEYHIFVRALPDNNLLQILTFIPCSIAENALIDLSRFLHIVNKELDMPGFCLDEDTKTVFYRVVIPCIGQSLDTTLFGAYLNTSKNICETFGTVIQAIAIGAMTLDEVFEKMAENAKNKK